MEEGTKLISFTATYSIMALLYHERRPVLVHMERVSKALNGLSKW